ncbi:MAG: hypothetical protein ACTSQZ_02605, partial [Candidatus Thorarchaeota archaeon]
YEMQVWNNQYFNDTVMMLDRHSEYKVVHDTADSGNQMFAPFAFDTEMRFQYKWPASMVPQSGVVDKLYFEVDTQFGETTFSNLVIYMLCVEDSASLTTDFQSNYDGRTPIQVLNRSSYTTITDHGFMEFDIENTFIVQENLNLIIEIRHYGYTGTTIQSNYTTGSVGGSNAHERGPGDYCADTASYWSDSTHGLRLELVSQEIFAESQASNTFPFGLGIGMSGRFQLKYNQSLIDNAGIIDRILFPVFGYENVTYENFSVYLCETVLEGNLSNTDMDSNYVGVTPTLVLDVDEYTVQNTGRFLVIDIDDIFYYSNTDELLIEIRFDSLVSGSASVHATFDGGGYRAWDWYGSGNDTRTYDLLLDFIFDTETVSYSGLSLANETTYYWRVRTCDSLGIWSPWATGNFTYEVLESEPNWTGLTESDDPLEFGNDVTVSITVTHTTEIVQVLIEYDGTNHTMTQSVDLFSHTWTPAATGANGYTIFMEAYSGVWAETSGSVDVEDTILPAWVTAPDNQTLDFGEALSYQLDATDLSGIDSWNVNDTVNFSFVGGLLTNNTNLPSGAYPLLLSVNDTEGNTLSAVITITVLASTTTTTTTTTTTATTTTTTTDTTDPTTPPPDGGDMTLILIIGGAIGAVLIIIIIVVMQKKKG